MAEGCQLLAACVRPIAPRLRLIARERWRWIAQVPSTSQGAAESVAQPGLSLEGKTRVCGDLRAVGGVVGDNPLL